MQIHAQIVAAKRELRLRQQLYPKWVERGTLRPESAEHELAAMHAIIGTLEREAQKQHETEPTDALSGTE
jgi:hypothetical protein